MENNNENLEQSETKIKTLEELKIPFELKEENIVKTKEVYTKDSNIGFTLECISEEHILKDEYQFGKDKNGRIIIQDIKGYFRIINKKYRFIKRYLSLFV